MRFKVFPQAAIFFIPGIQFFLFSHKVSFLWHYDLSTQILLYFFCDKTCDSQGEILRRLLMGNNDNNNEKIIVIIIIIIIIIIERQNM